MYRTRLITLLFHLSGYAALIYQVVWQRVLYSIYGVNIEAVTIIVSVFMAGLGIGALIGGALSLHFPRRVVGLFAGFEFSIAIFALFSLKLFHYVKEFTHYSETTEIIFINFLLLLPPTVFMGATLPLLVSFLTRSKLSPGLSVANLYFANTLGSGIASILTVLVLFPLLGLSGTVLLGVVLNILVGAGAGLVSTKAFLRPEEHI